MGSHSEYFRAILTTGLTRALPHPRRETINRKQSAGPQRLQLQIIFHDDHFVAVNKPAGMLVHRSRIDRRETVFAMQALRDQIGRRVYPVHRLDKPTSGVLVFALDPEAAAALSTLFSEGRVQKTYLAVVRGYTDAKGRIDHPLKEKPDRMTDGLARPDKAAQAAVTEYRLLATAEIPIPSDRHGTSRYSLIEVMPRTGRKHQIRRHLKHVFHPVIGDTTYGHGIHNRLFRNEFGIRRLLLAACELSFGHPYTDATCSLIAPLDEVFLSLLKKLAWQDAVPAKWTRGP